MSKIIGTINSAYADGKPTVSLEFFPAKTQDGINNLLQRVEEMGYSLHPTFVTLTWRSAFKNEDLWLKIGAHIQREFRINVLLHLTCHLPKTELLRILRRCREEGIKNILALRGDPPIGMEKWKSGEGCFSNAVDLIHLIREEHGDYFCVAVAGYPEVHTECWNSPVLPPSEQARDMDFRHLKQKIDAGADFIITQFFYDENKYFEFVRRCQEIGINVPILPGYLPIQNYTSFKKFTEWCKTSVPQRISAALESIKDDDDQVKAFGIQEAVRVCRRILAEGPFKSLHFYTMNLSQAVSKILSTLDIIPKANIRLLSWQKTTAMSAREGEEVRPIFWANRQSSYHVRTQGWDEYPNGRWGDKRSPAYGELSDYYLSFKREKFDRKKVWGCPEREEEVFAVFTRFIRREINCLPWCDLPPSTETNMISSNLEFLNTNGFLTINSQPMVDGAPSTDPDVGWGGPDGYVYQKAYVEFFCSLENLQLLLGAFERYPTLSYHAINLVGDEYTNQNPDTVNAVTWGVFPGHEVVQPTVVDVQSFKIWKNEALQLWMSQWAPAYEESSKSYKLIEKIYQNYYLVNIVDNDYSETADLFAIFRDAITNNMDSISLRNRVKMLEKENESLKKMLFELKNLQRNFTSENAALRGQLEESRKQTADMKREINEMKFSKAISSVF